MGPKIIIDDTNRNDLMNWLRDNPDSAIDAILVFGRATYDGPFTPFECAGSVKVNAMLSDGTCFFCGIFQVRIMDIRSIRFRDMESTPTWARTSSVTCRENM